MRDSQYDYRMNHSKWSGTVQEVYKGYTIERSWELDNRGKRVPGSTAYMVYDADENWIGDVYKSLGEAHEFIDDEVGYTRASSQKGTSMKKVVATTGKSTSKDYIKVALFDWLCDGFQLDIDGYPAEQVVDKIEALAPQFDVDDVLDLAEGEMVDVVEAIRMLEDERDSL